MGDNIQQEGEVAALQAGENHSGGGSGPDNHGGHVEVPRGENTEDSGAEITLESLCKDFISDVSEFIQFIISPFGAREEELVSNLAGSLANLILLFIPEMQPPAQPTTYWVHYRTKRINEQDIVETEEHAAAPFYADSPQEAEEQLRARFKETMQFRVEVTKIEEAGNRK